MFIEFMYVISISLQVSGALLLMINVLSVKREDVIRRFVLSGEIITKNNNTGEIKYNVDKFYDTFKEAYLSKIAFGYISFGYFFAVFSGIEGTSKIIMAIAVLIGCVGFILLAHKIVKIYMRFNKEIKKRITSEELKMLKIEPQMGNISDKDIDDLF